MSPPATFGPATPNRIAEWPLMPPALWVFAVGGTSVQYGLGGVTPLGQTIVARLGVADRAMTSVVVRPATGASHLRSEYLAISVLLSGTTPARGRSLLRGKSPSTDNPRLGDSAFARSERLSHEQLLNRSSASAQLLRRARVASTRRQVRELLGLDEPLERSLTFEPHIHRGGLAGEQGPGRDSHDCRLPRHRPARRDHHVGCVHQRSGIDRRARDDAVAQTEAFDRGDLL